MKDNTAQTKNPCGYAPINGLNMYYEVEGAGDPLVFIPPVFEHAGVNSFPALVRNHSVIAVDLQGHGRTADIPDRPITFEQHAKDVVGLLEYLGITNADFFGDSWGGVIATVIAVHYPAVVRRVATFGATFGAPQTAVKEQVLRANLTPDGQAVQFKRDNYKRVAPDPDYWPKIWDKALANPWAGFTKEELASIKAPLLIALGDDDFVRLEHAVEAHELIPTAELAVIPDAGHYAPHSEPERVIPVVQHFLEKPERRAPIGTAESGYFPGKTR
jgi:pimeloyl-ACP methyl ester carboxylesterase